MKTAKEAKVEMKRRGHSYRSAAQYVGRSYQWISDVLNGHKKSRPVIEEIYKLPTRVPPARKKETTETSKVVAA